MSYELSPAFAAQLTAGARSIDRAIVDVTVELRNDYSGEVVLEFLVLLDDSLNASRPSLRLGQRLLRIASELRKRAAEADVPLFASVRFATRSELVGQRRHA